MSQQEAMSREAWQARELEVLGQMQAWFPLARWEQRSAPGVVPAIWCAARPPAGDAVSWMVRADGSVRCVVVQGDELREGEARHPADALDTAAYGLRREPWAQAAYYARLAWEEDERLGMQWCVGSPRAAIAIWLKGWTCRARRGTMDASCQRAGMIACDATGLMMTANVVRRIG